MSKQTVPQFLTDAHGFLVRYQADTWSKISKFLTKTNLCTHPYELSQLRVDKGKGLDITVKLPALTLSSTSMGSLRNIRPAPTLVKDMELSLRFGINGNQIFSHADFIVRSQDVDTKYCAFHLDTMPALQGTHRFVHPYHHFQFGGNSLTKFGFTNPTYYGRLMFLDTPRISAPPMDVGIALHFVCSNFLPQGTYPLNQYPEFETGIRVAQKHLWSPFYQTIANYWNSPANKDMAERYLPELI